MTTATRLRQRLEDDRILTTPGVYDPISARVVEETGMFDALKLVGSGSVFARTGLPDAGLATMTEMVHHAKAVQDAVSLPVIADADNGYGNAINVVRTVEAFIDAGVAGLHIEDQTFPKRNGDVTGVEVLPLEEARLKMRAAVDVRDDIDPEVVLIGRTDVRRTADGTIEDAIERANAFLEEGVDMVFLKVPETIDEVERAGEDVDGNLMYPCSGTAVRLSPEDLEGFGWDVAFYGRMTIHPAINAIRRTVTAFAEAGVSVLEEDEERFHEHYPSVHHLAGIEDIASIERRYLPDEELRKYDGATGHEVQSE